MSKSLNGNWILSCVSPEGKQLEIPGRVPGNVIGDLHRAGVIPDPYFGCNANLLRDWEFVDYTYRTGFPAERPAKGETVELVFRGIDTISEVRLNGELLGKPENMFIDHRFEVTGKLNYGEENTLEVAIFSPVTAARKYSRAAHTMALAYNYESLFIRKAAHTFGWDIAPRLVGGGLWRGVELEYLPEHRWTDILLFTTGVKPGKSADLTLDWNFTTSLVNLSGLEAKLTMIHGDSRFETRFPLFFVTGKHRFSVPEPHLWHPRGKGEPALYDVSLELIHKGEVLAVRRFRTGIRTVRLDRTECFSPSGEGEFRFIVNNEPCFILGSNYVPADALHGERPERPVEALKLFADLNCNMVRCWGGGVYEDHSFYDYCDENGLLVWQDFMMGCVIPPRDDEFCKRLEEEAVFIVKKLRNHPSIAIWSGDNECDEATTWSNDGSLPSENRVNREVFKFAARCHDPGRDYLPSSPYLTDRAAIEHSRSSAPEQHLWGPRDDYKGDFYRLNNACFASETGYHGMPALESLKEFLSPDHLYPKADDPEHLVHCAQPWSLPDGAYAYRINLMLKQITNTFGEVPEDLEELIFASQAVQLEAVKFFIENFRFHKWRKTGILWWNVIDCWPQTSDAVVDYYGRRKLAYECIKNVQQPVLMMMGEPQAWHCELKVTNDSVKEAAGAYKVTDVLTGETVAEGRYTCPVNGIVTLDPVNLLTGKDRMFLLEWQVEEDWKQNHYLLGRAPYDLAFYKESLKNLSY